MREDKPNWFLIMMLIAMGIVGWIVGIVGWIVYFKMF
jgi:hypothetical protein